MRDPITLHHMSKIRIRALPEGQDDASSVPLSIPDRWCDKRDRPPENYEEHNTWYLKPMNHWYC